jgi:hypothetical protein
MTGAGVPSTSLVGVTFVVGRTVQRESGLGA